MIGVAASISRLFCDDAAGFAGASAGVVAVDVAVDERSGEMTVSVRLTLALFFGGWRP